MYKRISLALGFLSVLFSLACTQAAEPSKPTVDVDPWFAAGQARLQHSLKQQANNKPAKNVILFVGDGMSVATVAAARILEGQLRGESGEENVLSFESFPYTGLSKTYNTNAQTPDSAGTATAMLSGVKTKIGVLGLNDQVVTGDCASTAKSIAPTLLELAEQQGFKTGVISTTRITHATPASSYAHAASREWEAHAPAGCADIASQLVDFSYGDGIEVILGGGRAPFLAAQDSDPEYTDKKGSRPDGKNLIKLWQDNNPKGEFIWNKKQFDALPVSDDKILGLFEPSHMQYEADRSEDKAGEPSIADMTEFAIQRLMRNKKKASTEGFFLLVEGGRIDHAHHGANAYRALHDTLAFAEAIKAADALTNDEDTLIIVTADHGHVLEFAGYPGRGNPILGKVANDFDAGERKLSLDASGKPYTTLGYLNGSGYTGQSQTQAEGHKSYPHRTRMFKGISQGRPDLTDVDTEDKNYLQESAVPMGSETHSGSDVAVYAKGPSAHLLTGVYEQNYIFHVMQHALRLN